MKILWINPSFLDYRVPVYKELNNLLDGQLTLIYSKARTPERVIKKIESALGIQAIGLTGEKKFEYGRKRSDFANSYIRIPYQPGLRAKVMGTPTDVIIAEGFFQWTPAALVKSLVQRKPLIIAYERTHHTERNSPFWRTWYRKMMIKFVDVVLCSGSQCRDYVVSLGLPPARTTIGHMTADVENLGKMAISLDGAERETVRRQYDIQGVCYLYVGRLISLKGIMNVLEAWSHFEKQHAGSATFVLVGDGPLRQNIQDFISIHNLRNVRVVGHVDYDGLARYYISGDVFILPTLEDNWALVIPEAMSCGLPLLCSRYTGSWSELLQNGINGWVFDPLSVNSTINNLELCYLSRERLPQMGQISKEILRNHTPHKAAQSIVEGCHIALEHRNRKKRKLPLSEDQT